MIEGRGSGCYGTEGVSEFEMVLIIAMKFFMKICSFNISTTFFVFQRYRFSCKWIEDD